MQNFEGKVAVITGAASGIGFAMAERFAQEGMRVVLADVEAPALEAAVTRLRLSEHEVLGVPDRRLESRGRGGSGSARFRDLR